MHNFVVIAVSLDGLAPSGARPSAGTVMTVTGTYKLLISILVYFTEVKKDVTKLHVFQF